MIINLGEQKETKNVLPFIDDHCFATFPEPEKETSFFSMGHIDRVVFAHLHYVRTREVEKEEEEEKKLH